MSDTEFRVVAALRNPAALANTEFGDVETIAAELGDLASMTQAAQGMDAILANLPFTFDRDEARLFGANLATAARTAGVQKIVFNTSCYVHTDDIGVDGHDGRRDIEAALIDGGAPYVIFEPMVFMDNMTRVWCKPSIVNNNVFAYPAGPSLKVSWICLEDVAAFMVEALKQPDAPSGRYKIGGPEALTGFEIAQRLSVVTGRPVEFKSLTPAEFASAMSLLVTGSADVEPESIYERMAEFYRWYNSQPTSPLTVDLEPILKRFPITPTPFSEWAQRHDWTDPSDPALAIRMAGAMQ